MYVRRTKCYGSASDGAGDDVVKPTWGQRALISEKYNIRIQDDVVKPTWGQRALISEKYNIRIQVCHWLELSQRNNILAL